jgi:UDP-glucose 4-epimerase
MRVSIVTGGCGFIGSHLAELLIKHNHKVYIIDNLSTGSLKNISKIEKNQNLILEDINIIDYKKLEAFVNKIGKIDYVFHLAALADIVPSIEKPQAYFNANVVGTFKFIYTASSSCYGIPKAIPTSESCDLDPKYPYALTKMLGEEISLNWGKVYKIPVISLRLFNVYGPRSRTTGTYGAVFGVFLAQKLANKPLTVVGDGTQTRDFIFVADVANAYLKSALSSISNEIFNIGSGYCYSINHLVKLLNAPAVFLPKRPGEPDVTLANITKISKYLKWSPEISFENGVKIMLDEIENWKDAPVWNEKTIHKATENWFKYLG